MAGSAGYTCVPSGDQDFDGVDFTIRDGVIGVDIQLKATDSPLRDKSGNFLVDLDRRTYNLLSPASRLLPAYLVLVTVGATRASWVTHLPGQTVLNHEARWLRLTGLPVTANSSSVRVTVPNVNLLTAISLSDLLEQTRKGVGL